MSLIDYMMSACVIMNKSKVADGEGGFVTTWTEDTDEIRVAIVHNSTMEARIAEKDGVKSTYTLTTTKDIKLKHFDVIKRKSDGAIFRVTSDSQDTISPSVSSLNMAQVSAERWELTT